MKQKWEMLLHRHKTSVLVLAALGTLLTAEVSLAITAPAATANALGYDLYNVAVNQLLKGPIGFVGGLAAVLYGASQIAKSWMVAGLSVLGGSAVIKADTIVTSLGALI